MARTVDAAIWSEVEIAEVARLWASGMETRAIGVRLGRPLPQVKRLINGDREKFPRRYDDSGLGRRIATLAARGMSLRGGAAGKAMATTDPLFAGTGIPLVRLTARSCRYPVSGEKAETLFCGGEASRGAWCDHHARRVYQAVPA